MYPPVFLGPLHRMLDFMGRWRSSRDWRLLWQGLPALVAATSVLALALLVLHVNSTRLAWYRTQAALAFETGQHARAMICYERLLFAPGDHEAALYRIALLAESQKQPGRTRELLLALAPANRQGYGPAHLEVARRIFGQAQLSLDDRQAAETHLLRALEDGRVEREMAHALLGELYLLTGRLNQASAHLDKARALPHVRLRIAQLRALEGRADEAKKLANDAADYYRKKLREHPFSDHDCFRLAEALKFLEQFPDAVSLLRDRLVLPPASPLLRRALTEIYTTWLDTLARAKENNLAERLEVARAALEHDPSDAGVVLRLWMIANGPDKDQAAARALLRAQLAEGKNPAMAHFALGTDAWQRGEHAEARLHMEQAYRAGPQLAIVGNNLAWMLTHSEPRQLPRALELINSVLRQYPDAGRFRGTRGHVLVEMKRWDEALPDLVAALPVDGHDPSLHEALADVYRRLGSPAMAAEHEKKAKAIRNLMPTK
jgi:hypothetical protein